MNFLTILICAVVVGIIVVYFCKGFSWVENFSDTENNKIKDIFESSQKNNETYQQVKQKITSGDIKFSTRAIDPSFGDYYELYKNYNKGTLNANTIDSIRTGLK